jgi:hypothetical protein
MLSELLKVQLNSDLIGPFFISGGRWDRLSQAGAIHSQNINNN